MSRGKKNPSTGVMLELWRPPQDAGDPLGCLATTYTFAPELFDEQCLARFLEIESEPNREDLPFLLERESRLGSVYAGVLVDHTQAGVAHSLRWDVLPVRIFAGKQHAKLSLLAWSRHIRIIVASANLTEPGYRTNHEVAGTVDLSPDSSNPDLLVAAIAFLRSVVRLVPGAAERPPVVQRAETFLRQVEQRAESWAPIRRGNTTRQHLAFSLPPVDGADPRSALEEGIQHCRARGGSPNSAWVASPFFDADATTSRVTAALCKLMARGGGRELTFCVPAVRSDVGGKIKRLAAPKALVLTPPAYQGTSKVKELPDFDDDKNPRTWHAKMLALFADSKYSALMIGSSNFTCAGMGVGQHRNAEANLLTIVDCVAFGRETGQLESVWPEMAQVDDPETAEWLGAQPDREEEEQSKAPPWPAGFLSATYRAGNVRHIELKLDPSHLPDDWHVHSSGSGEAELLAASVWRASGSKPVVVLAWAPAEPPPMLRIRWAEHIALMPLNVEDSRELPPPPELASMSADDMLGILAAADPSAACRVWARRLAPSDIFDADLDSATPTDLDPLRRYDLQATFLHRIRRRARVLAQLRANLQRPVWGQQALEWRLRGLIGIEPLADRLMREFTDADGGADEALLTLTDFLIVLHETDYQPAEGSLRKTDFDKSFRPFLKQLANKLNGQVDSHRDRLPSDLVQFWDRVVERCEA